MLKKIEEVKASDTTKNDSTYTDDYKSVFMFTAFHIFI